jgi:predicted RecB family nuclease
MTSDKASRNILLLKLFRLEYKTLYNLDIYTIECVAHTLNNVVQDIVSFILYIEKIDRTIIQSTINEDLFDNNNQIIQDMKLFLIYI